MRNRLFDLETIAHPDARLWADPVKVDARLLEPIKPDARLTDPVKVAANRVDVERRQAEREVEIAAFIAEKEAMRSLDPDLNRIVALGYYDVWEAEPTVYLMRDEFEEREQLKLFWASYAQMPTRLISFYGQRFDLPVIVMRSLYLQVKHPEIVVAPSWKSPHVDLWERLTLGGARKDVKGLQWYAKRNGWPVYDDITGADVAAMVAAGEWQKVHDHCLSDLTLTRLLAEWLDVLKPAAVGAPF